jgi:hypothetical protein
MNLERVEWRDAFFDFDLKSVEEARDEYLCQTVGWVLSEEGNFLTLAQELLPEGEGFRGVTHIPHAIIENRWILDRVVQPVVQNALSRS